MAVEILPVTVAMRMLPWPKRWLVYQTDATGKLLYAQTFVRRSSADSARKEANERTRRLSVRMPAIVTQLPHDRR